MNNLKTNIKFEEFIGKLPYTQNNSFGGSNVFVFHVNEVPLEPEDEHYGDESWQKFVLDKKANEIITNFNKGIIVTQMRVGMNVREFNYVESAYLNNNNNLELLLTGYNDIMVCYINEEGYPYYYTQNIVH